MAQRATIGVWLGALAVAFFQVMGSFGAADNQPERKAIGAVAVLLLLVGPASLAIRHRWPLLAVAVTMAAADLYIGLGYPYGPVFAGVIVACASSVLAGRRQSTWLVAAGGYAGFVAASSLDPRADGPGLLHLAVAAAWLAMVLAVAEAVRSRREQAAAAERAQYEEKQRRAGEQRLSLARELHDVLAHNISLINVQASVALHLLDTEPERARPALATIKQTSREALNELRTALDVLRQGEEAPRAPAPGLADLDTLVEGVRSSGLDVRLAHDRPAQPLPAAVELAVYRIVQEALTNVTRHARAASANVRVDYGDGVTVEVADDGVGGTAVAGNGINGMRERAAALGGEVKAGPAPGGGFRVVARIPVGRTAEAQP